MHTILEKFIKPAIVPVSDFVFGLTCVYTYPESQLVIGSVSDLESFDLL